MATQVKLNIVHSRFYSICLTFLKTTRWRCRQVLLYLKDALIGQVRIPGIHFDRDVVWIQFWSMRSGFFWWKINVLTLNEFKCGHYLWRRSCTTVFAGERQWLYFTNHGVEECVRRQKPGCQSVCANITKSLWEMKESGFCGSPVDHVGMNGAAATGQMLARGPPGDEGVDCRSETGDATEGRGRSAWDGGQVKR